MIKLFKLLFPYKLNRKISSSISETGLETELGMKIVSIYYYYNNRINYYRGGIWVFSKPAAVIIPIRNFKLLTKLAADI